MLLNPDLYGLKDKEKLESKKEVKMKIYIRNNYKFGDYFYNIIFTFCNKFVIILS